MQETEGGRRRFMAALVAIAVAAGALGFAIVHVAKEPVDGDIHVFWKAGYDYVHGNPLYDTPPGLLAFIYPPFAALLFAPLGLLPFKVAAFIFFVGNYLAWILTFVWIAKCLRLFHDEGPLMPWVIGIAWAETFKLFLNNLTHIQFNSYVFLPALMAVYFFLAGRDKPAIVLAGMATSMKLTPLVLFLWMVLRRQSLTFFIKCVVVGGMFVVLPAVLRGPAQGIADLQDYYDTFLSVFVGGGVNVNSSNQNLSGTIMRYCTDLSGPGGDNGGRTFHLVECDAASVRRVTRLISIALLAAVVASSFLQRRAGIPANLYEASAYLLTSHLVAGCTWKAHLITLSLPLAVVAADVLSGRNRSRWLVFLLGYFGLLGILGKEIIGAEGMIFLGAYGGYAIGMLLVVLTFLVLPFRTRLPTG
jgi:hypothetical protein